ncbi:hypothetical protein HIV01_012360 [Lysobacter arenosi]|uniref:Uncharacterized protein n=1 Tax=Lysobacter arenosi TaxID=2795387 RepID=A0ABX7R7N4_9GAMM|nr:hypothetical protein [Lysobacter arenosi]QSX74010.1 hypothetical protein HIV01_012360 [Lysobacter arenosi]
MSIAADRDHLETFITKVYDWLEACYAGFDNGSQWPVFQIHPDLRRFGAEAWEEFKSDLGLPEILRLVHGVSEHELKAHGLYGNQLRYKLSVIEHLVSLGSASDIVLKFIDAIDVLLDSVISALGRGAALKELKDMLRVSAPGTT